MAGWSLPSAASAGPSDAVAEILRRLRSVGFCSDLNISDEELGGEKLGSTFDRILSVFLGEIYQRGEIRPLPAMLGDGRPVDLLRLYWGVREKGGYDAVTANELWAAVSEEIGLDRGVGSSLKLIYAKYLNALERWLQRVLEKRAAAGRVQREEKPGLTTKAGGVLLHQVSDPRKKDYQCTPPSGSKKDQFLTPVRVSGRRLQLDDGGSDNGDVVAMERGAGDGGFSHLKRKRESLVGMLNWVRTLAKNPVDPTHGNFLSSDAAKGNSHPLGELFSQALLARQALFLKRIRNNIDGSVLQRDWKVLPSVHQDNIGESSQMKEKIGCSQKLRSVNNQSYIVSCSETLTVLDDDTGNGQMAEDKESNDGKRRLRNPSLMLDSVASWLSKDHQHTRIPIGSHFQVQVPEWTGKPSVTSNDPDTLKWLGTRIWPPENQENRLSLDYSIGQGRPNTCQCKHPGSVECVRFHVAEKRLQLKCELGSVFHSWRFDRMGEEVALSWTEEEERKFKAIVRLNPPSLNKNYWDQLRLCFPFKGKRNLVSYYFNVFLVARRSYQNRVTPNTIDSDDEEREFGFLSSPFGHNAVRVRDSKSVICAHNTHCVDFDE